MFHRPECRKYRQWKREQSKKSRQAVKKEKKVKRRDSIADCIDEDEWNNVSEDKQKIISPKCKKKIRIRRKPRASASYVLKRVSLAEIVLKKIQPSMEVREQLINPRHVICLDDSDLEMDFPLEIPETTRTPYQTHRPRWRPKGQKRRRRIAKKMVKGKKEKKKGKKGKKGKKEQGEPEEQQGAEKEEGEPEEQQGEEKEEDEPEEQLTDEKATTGKAEENVKTKGTRKRSGRKMKKKKRKKKVADTDSEEDSECDSICSFDSHVCLAGLKLTAEDRNKIKEYQRQAEDTNTEGNVTPPD